MCLLSTYSPLHCRGDGTRMRTLIDSMVQYGKSGPFSPETERKVIAIECWEKMSNVSITAFRKMQI